MFRRGSIDLKWIYFPLTKRTFGKKPELFLLTTKLFGRDRTSFVAYVHFTV
jgi:hypothetical protein